MNYSNFLFIFTSLLGRNDEKNGTIVIPSFIENHQSTPLYESSTYEVATLLSNEIYYNDPNTCIETATPLNDPGDDLRTRNCMCDENCAIYDDCCEDSPHRGKFAETYTPFTCLSTPMDGDIYVVDECPSDYTELEMIFKCETTLEPGIYQDLSFILPVTSTRRNITYRNSYCAICNNETVFEFWDTVLYYELEKINGDDFANDTSLLLDEKYYSIDDHAELLSNLEIENDSRIVSKFNNLTYRCEILIKMPSNISARYCRSDVGAKVFNSYVADSFIGLSSDGYFSNIIHLDRNTLPKNLFNPCKKVNYSRKFHTEVNSYIKTCVYTVQTGDPCLVNSFFLEEKDILYVQNEEIFVKKYNATFDPTEYTNETTYKNVIYVCGTELPSKDEKKLLFTIKVFLARLSNCLLVLYLILNANKKSLQSLSDKMTYAYSFTMVPLYIAFEMHRHPKWCIFTDEAFFYLMLCHFGWFAATSYELWHVICRLSVKFQSVTGKSHRKKFIIYCLICWITPLPVIPITMYHRRFINNPANCPSIPGYRIRKPCLGIPQSPIAFYVFIINSAIIFVNVLLFIHICYHIYLTKRRNIKSTNRGNYVELFVKLALTMDLQWILYLFSFTDMEILKTANTLLTSCHGLILFLAYGLKKSMFVNIYKYYKTFVIVRKFRNTFCCISRGKIRRVPFSKCNSVEPPTQNTGAETLSSV